MRQKDACETEGEGIQNSVQASNAIRGRVRINEILSSVLSISTGAPQCCVLSAILFIIYTNELRSRFRNCHLIKYADDTVIVGLISNNDESEYNEQISEVVQWCKDHNLLLNDAKTKELIFDFRHCNISHVPLSIDNSIVEMCDNFKYLGLLHLTVN